MVKHASYKYILYICIFTYSYLFCRSFDTQSGKLKCVSHHPIEKHYFITASVKGHVDLWDERYLDKSRSYLTRLPHKKGVLSAFFSPTSGEKILSCSAGDEIKYVQLSLLHLHDVV